MQIDIDFEVFQALTVLRRDESDSYNAVIRRLLKLADDEAEGEEPFDHVRPVFRNALAAIINGPKDTKDGAWIGNVYFPNGTRFRATYKGKTYRAEIRDNVWIGEDGRRRQSPSEAASAISGTSVNGWRFWYGLRPTDYDWRRLDEFRK